MSERLSFEVGKKCPICKKICEPYHWVEHNSEAVEEDMFGDDWP